MRLGWVYWVLKVSVPRCQENLISKRSNLMPAGVEQVVLLSRPGTKLSALAAQPLDNSCAENGLIPMMLKKRRHTALTCLKSYNWQGQSLDITKVCLTPEISSCFSIGPISHQSQALLHLN